MNREGAPIGEQEQSEEGQESSLERDFDQSEVDNINDLLDRIGGLVSLKVINNPEFVSESQRRDIRNYVAEWQISGGIDNGAETKRIAKLVNEILE